MSGPGISINYKITYLKNIKLTSSEIILILNEISSYYTLTSVSTPYNREVIDLIKNFSLFSKRNNDLIMAPFLKINNIFDRSRPYSHHIFILLCQSIKEFLSFSTEEAILKTYFKYGLNLLFELRRFENISESLENDYFLYDVLILIKLLKIYRNEKFLGINKEIEILNELGKKYGFRIDKYFLSRNRRIKDYNQFKSLNWDTVNQCYECGGKNFTHDKDKKEAKCNKCGLIIT